MFETWDGIDLLLHVVDEVLGPVSDPFFSPWEAVFAATFPILVIYMNAVVFLAWKEKQKKRGELGKPRRKREKKAEGKSMTQPRWGL